jgi:hypothetical protein
MGHNVPFGRVGRAEEFANVACFLASALASYVRGTSIDVDGNLRRQCSTLGAFSREAPQPQGRAMLRPTYLMIWELAAFPHQSRGIDAAEYAALTH